MAVADRIVWASVKDVVCVWDGVLSDKGSVKVKFGAWINKYAGRYIDTTNYSHQLLEGRTVDQRFFRTAGDVCIQNCAWLV